MISCFNFPPNNMTYSRCHEFVDTSLSKIIVPIIILLFSVSIISCVNKELPENYKPFGSDAPNYDDDGTMNVQDIELFFRARSDRTTDSGEYALPACDSKYRRNRD